MSKTSWGVVTFGVVIIAASILFMSSLLFSIGVIIMILEMIGVRDKKEKAEEENNKEQNI